MYQVLPGRGRLAIQTTVEGIVPFAIGISGVLILIINALPPPSCLIVVTILVCGIWTWVAVVLYRAYAPALVAALDRRRHLDPDAAFQRPTTGDNGA
jgi:hypothetical protein